MMHLHLRLLSIVPCLHAHLEGWLHIKWYNSWTCVGSMCMHGRCWGCVGVAGVVRHPALITFWKLVVGTIEPVMLASNHAVYNNHCLMLQDFIMKGSRLAWCGGACDAGLVMPYCHIFDCTYVYCVKLK